MSTEPRLTVTQVVEADVADLVPSMLAYARFYGADPSTDDLTAMALALIATGKGTQLIARDASGEPLGHATVLWSWDTTLAQPLAVMEDLFVTAQARGRGVGAGLIDACRQLAADRGIRWLAWETAPDNDTAQRLYDGLGAKRDTWYAYRLSTDRPAS